MLNTTDEQFKVTMMATDGSLMIATLFFTEKGGYLISFYNQVKTKPFSLKQTLLFWQFDDSEN